LARCENKQNRDAAEKRLRKINSLRKHNSWGNQICFCQTSFIGVCPVSRDGGAMCGRRTIRGGRPIVRAALYRAALVDTTRLRAFYQQLFTAGKPNEVARTACMRKLLTILNSMVKYDQPWKYDVPYELKKPVSEMVNAMGS
jgi:Transposase IS116/IS110/IS902 family